MQYHLRTFSQSKASQATMCQTYRYMTSTAKRIANFQSEYLKQDQPIDFNPEQRARYRPFSDRTPNSEQLQDCQLRMQELLLHNRRKQIRDKTQQKAIATNILKNAGIRSRFLSQITSRNQRRAKSEKVQSKQPSERKEIDLVPLTQPKLPDLKHLIRKNKELLNLDQQQHLQFDKLRILEKSLTHFQQQHKKLTLFPLLDSLDYIDTLRGRRTGISAPLIAKALIQPQSV